MQLAELTDPSLIFPDLEATDADAVLRELAQRLAELGRVRKAGELFHRLREREGLGSTALGHGVAVPHCRYQGLSELLLAVAVSREGVEFAAEDEQPVHLFFLVVSPKKAAAEHLRCLAAISKWVKDGHTERLLELREPEEIYRLIDDVARVDV